MGDYDFKPGGGLKFKGGGDKKKCVRSFSAVKVVVASADADDVL